jgi:hypothetical protein
MVNVTHWFKVWKIRIRLSVRKPHIIATWRS